MDWLLYITIPVVFVGFNVFAWKKPGWGLVLLPFAIGVIVMVGLIEPVYEIIIIMGAFLFPVTLGIVRWAPSSSSLEMPWHKTVAKTVIIFFQYLFLLVILCYLLNVFGGILFLLLIVGILRFFQIRKYSLTMDVLSAIGMSMRQSLPLPTALITASHGQKRKEAQIFESIAHWLTQGYPLSEAMARGYRKCPSDLLASISVAEKMNQLPEAIKTLHADLSEKVNDLKQIQPVQPWYPFVVLFLAFNVVLGLMYFIVPVYAEVLSDMSDGRSGLPAATQVLLNMSMWLKGRHGLNILLVLLPFTWIGLHLLYARFRKRNPQQPRLLSQLGDWIKWHLPFWGWFEKVRSQLQLTETLKIGLSAGYPVNTTLRNAINLDMNYCFQKRLLKWLEKIEQGQNIAGAASRFGVGKMLAWALDESVNKGNAPVLLQTLEEVYRARYNYRSKILNAVFCPLMVVALAACVGFVVYAMFLPMVLMIQVLL